MTTMSFELERIEELCRIRGWSHYRLAKEMDVSPNSIGNLFRRTSIPSVPTIRHICEAMGITISQFYSTDGSAATITEQQKAFLELFDRLSPGDKKKAEGYIEGLLAKSQSEPKKAAGLMNASDTDGLFAHFSYMLFLSAISAILASFKRVSPFTLE